jgi:hypothetical protein
MKMAVFWIVAPCSLVDDRPDDVGSKHLWNVGKLLPDYTEQQPRRQPSLGNIFPTDYDWLRELWGLLGRHFANQIIIEKLKRFDSERNRYSVKSYMFRRRDCTLCITRNKGTVKLLYLLSLHPSSSEI